MMQATGEGSKKNVLTLEYPSLLLAVLLLSQEMLNSNATKMQTKSSNKKRSLNCPLQLTYCANPCLASAILFNKVSKSPPAGSNRSVHLWD